MFSRTCRNKIVGLVEQTKIKRTTHDRANAHIKALAIQGQIVILQFLLNNYFDDESIEEVLEQRIQLLERSRDRHLDECALPDDCHSVIDYNARIEELQWLLEVINEQECEVPVPHEGDQPNVPIHL